jgi:hypothetical protein
MAARASRFAAPLAEWDRASAKTDPPARTGVVVKTRDARSRDMLAMLAAAGSGPDARPSNPSTIKAAVNA